MSTRTKKKTKRSPPKAGKANDKYDPEFIDQVRMLVLQCGMIGPRGEIAWTKVAKYLKVSVSTIGRWRDPRKKEYYKKAFAEAVERLHEEVAVGKVKRDMVTAAGRHIKHKTTREPVTRGPAPPRAVYGKKELIKYAAVILDPPLKLNMYMSRPAMLLEIDVQIQCQTTRKMEKVRTEGQEVFGEPTARALVVGHMGPEEGRWMAKEGRVHEAKGSLGRLLDQIGEQETRLPGTYVDDDKETVGPKDEESILAAEQPILDNGPDGPTG